MNDVRTPGLPPAHEFTGAEIGAIAHLYRGEVYRSTIWRTRLDNTTNWAVVTIGIALSVSFYPAIAASTISCGSTASGTSGSIATATPKC